MPLISVLMSVYNEPIPFVEKAVNSILEQTFEDFEFFIVLDNPSYKEMVNYLENVQRNDNRIKLLINDSNIGLAQSLNRAMKYANGSYYARMDADDISKPNRFECELEYMRKNDLDVVCCIVDKIDESGNVWGEVEPLPNSQRAISRLLPLQNIIVHPTVLMKATSIDSLNGYRSFSTCQDYDLWLRLLTSGKRIGILNEKLVLFRRHKSSITATRRYLQILNERYIRKLYKERLKGKNEDSFSEENKMFFLEKYGYNNIQKVERENLQLTNFQNGVKHIKNRAYIKGLTILFKATSSKSVRELVNTSIKAKIIKKIYKFHSGRRC